MKKWPPEIVIVEWVDSMKTSSWQSLDAKVAAMEEPDTLKHMSCGFLLKKTKDYIAVTDSVGIGVKNVSDSMQIPMCAVKKITRLQTK